MAMVATATATLSSAIHAMEDLKLAQISVPRYVEMDSTLGTILAMTATLKVVMDAHQPVILSSATLASGPSALPCAVMESTRATQNATMAIPLTGMVAAQLATSSLAGNAKVDLSIPRTTALTSVEMEK